MLIKCPDESSSYLVWVPPEEQLDHEPQVLWDTGGQLWELLLLVRPALKPHCPIERVALPQDLVGDGTDGPGISLAVIENNAAAWNSGSDLQRREFLSMMMFLRGFMKQSDQLKLWFTSGAIREAFPPRLTHMLLKGSCRLQSL